MHAQNNAHDPNPTDFHTCGVISIRMCIYIYTPIRSLAAIRIYTMSLVWVVILLLAFLYIYYRWGYLPYQVFKKMNVPGPPPLPFFGNLIPMIIKNEGLEVICEWNQKYGPVCGFFCGTWPALAVTDPLFIQNVFITKFRHFPDRNTMSLANTQATGLPPGLFEYSNCADHWKIVKHITMPAFTKAKLTMMSCYLQKSCLVMLDKMLEESSTNQSIDIMRIYKDCVLESSILAVLGQEVRLQRGEACEFKSWIELGSNISHGKHPLSQLYMFLPVDLFIGYQFTWLVKLYYWLSLGRYLPAFQRLKTVIANCITERRQKAQAQQLQENCVLNLLVAAASDCTDDGLFSDEEIISNCITFLFAAYDTTSLTMTCASHLLATNTHVQDKLCALLDDYWSQNKNATVSDVAQEIPYLDMVLDETMRLYPPSPRVARICRESTEIHSVGIPKDMNIIVPVHYLHRIKSIWGDPDVFRPERFGKEESASRPPCCFLPMGLGPRNCVGLKLAKFLMKLMLVTILKHHRFTSTQRRGEILETECYCVTLSLKSKVLIGLEKRS